MATFSDLPREAVIIAPWRNHGRSASDAKAAAQLHIGARFSMPTASGPSPDVAPLRAWLDSGSLVSGLVAVVLVLAPAAHASLPDQSCIRAFTTMPISTMSSF